MQLAQYGIYTLVSNFLQACVTKHATINFILPICTFIFPALFFRFVFKDKELNMKTKNKKKELQNRTKKRRQKWTCTNSDIVLLQLVFLPTKCWSSSNTFFSGAGVLTFKSLAGQIRHSVANVSHRCDIFLKGDVFPEMKRRWATQTRYTLRVILRDNERFDLPLYSSFVSFFLCVLKYIQLEHFFKALATIDI